MRTIPERHSMAGPTGSPPIAVSRPGFATYYGQEAPFCSRPELIRPMPCSICLLERALASKQAIACGTISASDLGWSRRAQIVGHPPIAAKSQAQKRDLENGRDQARFMISGMIN